MGIERTTKYQYQTHNKEIIILPVLGHNAFTAIPSVLNSSAIPKTHIDMPYLAIV